MPLATFSKTMDDGKTCKMPKQWTMDKGGINWQSLSKTSWNEYQNFSERDHYEIFLEYYL